MAVCSCTEHKTDQGLGIFNSVLPALANTCVMTNQQRRLAGSITRKHMAKPGNIAAWRQAAMGHNTGCFLLCSQPSTPWDFTQWSTGLHEHHHDPTQPVLRLCRVVALSSCTDLIPPTASQVRDEYSAQDLTQTDRASCCLSTLACQAIPCCRITRSLQA